MKILLIGGGGREHAIAWKLSQSPLVTELLCAPGNAGISKLARCYSNTKTTDIEAIVSLAKSEKVDYCVVAPDDPLALGLVDKLAREGIPSFGPTAAAAKIEASKAFSKALMKKYDIPTAAYETFTDFDAACRHIDSIPCPIVVKADGLALGKGVIITRTRDEAKQAAKDMLVANKFGKSGASLVIEEFMTGREVTQLVFTDGKTVALMPSSQDHKRALDGDKGPNTGGMGAFAPSPYFTDDKKQETLEKIILPTINALNSEGIPFKGVLYFGLMMTPSGVKVVEYNARFGDPETQAILPLLKSDLLEIFLACTNETLDQIDIQWDDGFCTCVVIASGGYPEKYETGHLIDGIDMAQEGGAMVFHAGTKDGKGAFDGGVITAGGRVLGVSATAGSLKSSVADAYLAAGCISFENMHMRTDIGKI
ncbi:MAG: phosphoribosylamine--glycine ligase [Christensenellales bacterium]|jgi:phosphoribosylamine--glycine ligase